LFSITTIEAFSNADYEPCIVALARISAAKPHSMDVERIVSSYNLILLIIIWRHPAGLPCC